LLILIQIVVDVTEDLPVPVSQLHHDIKTSQYKDEVKEGVVISCTFGLIIYHLLTALICWVRSCKNTYISI